MFGQQPIGERARAGDAVIGGGDDRDQLAAGIT
jgi:hypothetical protein